jgi:2-keto-4-pentenoate hydratase/2-oxohepta-3-ene-1,7-dioic acid hydratase in catechol pathway
MKLISFVRGGQPGFGARIADGIVDLTGRLAAEVTTLKAAIERDLLGAAAAYVGGRRPELFAADLTLLPVIPDPAKILCIGLNYETHRAETKRPDVKHPTIFTRFPDCQVAHGQPIVLPRVSQSLDYEGELAIVIGRGGRYIEEAVALEHIAGYSCYNEGSIRDWQRHTHQFTPGKNFPATGAFGPHLLTADEVADYTKLPIETRLNGEVMQRATLADLIFPAYRLLLLIYAARSGGRHCDRDPGWRRRPPRTTRLHEPW